jgi:hypothetical protein
MNRDDYNIGDTVWINLTDTFYSDYIGPAKITRILNVEEGVSQKTFMCLLPTSLRLESNLASRNRASWLGKKNVVPIYLAEIEYKVES